MLSVKSFVFNEFQENTYVIWDQTKACAIIDPGCMHAYERQELKQFIESNGLLPKLLLNTHCHIDHVLGNEFVADTFKLPLHLHEGELSTYQETKRWTALFNMPDLALPQQTVFIKEGEVLHFGETELEILFTPGHSVASVSFFHRQSLQLFSGDVLFKRSIGRTDLPGGSLPILLKSIREQLYVLPAATKVYSGHFETTTIGEEMQYNPYTR
jgi:glyoxylase-like metal-dependent hydrolase (beta-lactamase superfamily II)